MKCILFIDDELHKKALESYFNKYYKTKLDMVFMSYDTVDTNFITGKTVVIGEKIKLEEMGITESCLYISSKEINSINIYQSAKLFFESLESYSIDTKSNDDRVKIIGLSGVSGSVGTTLLSIHAAKCLGEDGKTLLISLEKIPSGKCYLEQARGHSFSNLIYYLKQNVKDMSDKMEIIKQLNSKEKFYYFSDVEYLEDILELNEEEIFRLLEILRTSNFKNIIIDFGTRIDLLCKCSVDKRIYVIEQDLKQYKRMEIVSKYVEKQTSDNSILLVNKKRHDVYINESYLRLFDTWSYIPYDFKLENGEQLMISSGIVQALRGIL